MPLRILSTQTGTVASFGTGFLRGDVDAPRVAILSKPLLALSMDVIGSEDIVSKSLKKTMAIMSAQADAYAIGCNTLSSAHFL
ncbi:hypothetical protein [Ensifer adhaerens]|uniref:hypothetical protein n=1 Tax=Ensifer adhaerens TaxID=106592 RepID=UPI00132F0420|nr:hypothetical protein [Ensifer adhaerens]QHG74958.1 hypothetical protein DQW09_35210 [Ensifer adhaerens]